MNKSHLLILCILLFSVSIFAQSIERQLIGSAGGNETTSDFLLDWTFGETFIAYDNTLIGDYKEGFLQPLNDLPQLTEEEIETNDETVLHSPAVVFPNPFNDGFTFQLNQIESSDIQLTILDYSGKVLLSKVLKAGQLSFDFKLEEHPTGLYFLQFTDHSGVQKQTFKLLKL